MDKHKPGYYKEYYARSEKAKEKSRRQAQKQKEARQKEIAKRPKCQVCGKPFIGRAIASAVTLSAGVHRRCDAAKWERARRAGKKKDCGN